MCPRDPLPPLLRPPSHQPTSSPGCTRSQHTAPIAAAADSGSRGCWRTKPLQWPSSHCTLPTMQLPLLPWPDWALAYPNMHPHPSEQPSSPWPVPSYPSHSIPKGSQSSATAAAQFWAGCRVRRGRGAGVQAARSLRSRCHCLCARHTHAPHPLPHPFLDAQSPPAGVAVSSTSAPRGRQQARPPAETPYDGHCSVTCSFG